MIPKLTPDERFWSRVAVEGENDCWLWLGACYPNGYGMFWFDGRNVGAHVYAYESSNPPILPGHIVCHTCDQPPCVNPKHLFTGTPGDNTQDMINKGRSRLQRKGTLGSGENCRFHVLTRDQVEIIRNEYQRGVRGRGARVLAKKHGVSPRCIQHIIQDETWRKR